MRIRSGLLAVTAATALIGAAPSPTSYTEADFARVSKLDAHVHANRQNEQQEGERQRNLVAVTAEEGRHRGRHHGGACPGYAGYAVVCAGIFGRRTGIARLRGRRRKCTTGKPGLAGQSFACNVDASVLGCEESLLHVAIANFRWFSSFRGHALRPYACGNRRTKAFFFM